MKKSTLYIILFSLISTNLIWAQSSSQTAYMAESYGSVASGMHTPFWMSSQTWGMVPLDANNGYLRGAVIHSNQINTNFSWKAGLDMAAATKHAFNTIWLQQIYAEATWKKWNFRIGPKENYTSLLNEDLSSGDLVFSNNARPIPEMNLSLTDYIHVIGNFYMKGDFALGKMLDGDYVKNIAAPAGQNYTTDVLTHHKSAYFRFGNFEKGHKNRFTVKVEHYCYWTGNSMIDGEEQNLPRRFSDLIRGIFVRQEGGTPGEGEYFYISGSHWGAYTLKFDHKLKNNDVVSLSWQHYIEDGSGLGPQNIQDMLLSLEYKSNKKRPITGAVLEYIYTKNQSGPVHFNVTMDEEHQYLENKGTGMDDYYDNAQYIQGPSYYGRSFGTPLFLSPEYNTDGTVNFESNRIISFHGAVEGYINKDISYRLRATCGETWGRYKIPYLHTRKGVASSIDLTYHSPKMEGLDIQFTAAFNKGSFFDDKSFGTGISLIKRGILSKK